MEEPRKRQVNVEQVKTHIDQKWGPAGCQMCHQGNWVVSDRVFEMREFVGGGLKVGGGPIIPVIPVTCDNCGRTVLINAVVAKIVDTSGDKQK